MPAASPSLEQLVELVGVTGALRLVERRGGTHFYVPHPSRIAVHHQLAVDMGLDPARALAAAYPQMHVMAPRGVAMLRRRRDIAIIEDFKTLSVTAIARKYEMTERNVYFVLERGLEGLPALPGAGANDAQGDLFGT